MASWVKMPVEAFQEAIDKAVAETADMAVKMIHEAVAAERERCAALMETFPEVVMHGMTQRVPTTNKDRAAAIRKGE